MRCAGRTAGQRRSVVVEGAVYLLGFEQGLRFWRPLLAPGGCLVVSECSWLCADPLAEATAFFPAGYPGMAGIAQNLERARAAGFGPSITSRCRQLPGGTSSMRRCKSAWGSSRPMPIRRSLP